MSRLTYISREFPPRVFLTPLGTFIVNGMDQGVMDEAKAANMWQHLERGARMGETCVVGPVGIGNRRARVWVFVGKQDDGGFLSITGPDTAEAVDSMMLYVCSMIPRIERAEVLT